KQLDDNLDEVQVHPDLMEKKQTQVEAALEGRASHLGTVHQGCTTCIPLPLIAAIE
ncbi:unnamed protein product, partial [Ectocarpus sp. 12 AP-2014]